MEVQERVKRFIVENFYVSDPGELTPDTSLITGYVDSTGMLEVITFLEEEFGIRIKDQEMVPANLETIRGIGAFVARKQAAAA
ncbi:MAG: acyl carrier protein [Anaeromyxobacter sp.]|nr:acyl carrier protein [Anaeromyxobacter sp.]